MSMSEKCNTLHRLLHFNFCGICDQSVMSLTPSGDPQPICCRPPKPRRRGEWGEHGDTFDWWWCELNRKRWRESFYQARNTSGLKCSCTTPLYNAAAWPHITRQQKPRWELLVIIAPTPTRHVKLCWSRKNRPETCETGLKKSAFKLYVDRQKINLQVFWHSIKRFGQPLTCEDLLLFLFFRFNKLNIFGFWTVDRTKLSWWDI